MTATPMIDQNRLWERLMRLAKIGATPKGGVCRLALGEADKKARDLLIDWCRRLGCRIRVDPIGNIFARRPGTKPDLPPVMTGSHLDTISKGGKFDGAYGVVAGVEIFQALDDQDIRTRAPLEVVAWTNEEGARFVPPMFGSTVFAGNLDLKQALGVSDDRGTRVGQALARIGYAGKGPVRPYAVDSYFEAHIEQGPILEQAGKSIGVVTAVQGIIWYDITLTGQAAHAGAAPMDWRKDALAAAVEWLQNFYDLAGNRFSPHGRATAGEISLSPGSRNAVPETVRLKVDMRHPDAAALEAMDRELVEVAFRIERTTGVKVDLKKVTYAAPVIFDDTCVQAVARATQMRGMTSMPIISGAGHDATQMAGVCPSAMIFVPCLDGLSHTETESATPVDLGRGCQVLMGAMLERAGID